MDSSSNGGAESAPLKLSPAHTRQWERVCQHARDIRVLDSIQWLLDWDQQCYMPSAGAEYRARQFTALAAYMHRLWTDRQFGDDLNELAAGPLADQPYSDAGATVRVLRRQVERMVRLPQTLVEALANARSTSQQIWVAARKANDFRAFAPSLAETFRLKRQQADALGWTASPYDPLFDEYEPDATAADAERVLADLQTQLVPLLDRIRGAPRRPDVSILRRHYPVAAQRRIGRRIASRIGFRLDAGRLDPAPHPFCMQVGPQDVRLTTRYDERFFSTSFFSTLHEAGHGLYEQGLRADQFGLAPGDYCSLGMHESQSRLWENLVGRSQPFWTFAFPWVQQAFPAALASVSQDQFYAAINDVQPSLIRVEADEATYNLHIVIRFRIERDLLEGSLAIDDLPSRWNDEYERVLGIRPPDDRQGVLQDIHWSVGIVGYFPTYALGNLYACQVYEHARTQVADMDAAIAEGRFGGLLNFLRRRIHHCGRVWSAGQLIERITGQALSSEPFMNHLRAKLLPIFAL
jgi:carboxypeptidase Taq